MTELAIAGGLLLVVIIATAWARVDGRKREREIQERKASEAAAVEGEQRLEERMDIEAKMRSKRGAWRKKTTKIKSLLVCAGFLSLLASCSGRTPAPCHYPVIEYDQPPFSEPELLPAWSEYIVDVLNTYNAWAAERNDQ